MVPSFFQTNYNEVVQNTILRSKEQSLQMDYSQPR